MPRFTIALETRSCPGFVALGIWRTVIGEAADYQA